MILLLAPIQFSIAHDTNGKASFQSTTAHTTEIGMTRRERPSCISSPQGPQIISQIPQPGTGRLFLKTFGVRSEGRSSPIDLLVFPLMAHAYAPYVQGDAVGPISSKLRRRLANFTDETRTGLPSTGWIGLILENRKSIKHPKC